jgi:hypothetical protein
MKQSCFYGWVRHGGRGLVLLAMAAPLWAAPVLDTQEQGLSAGSVVAPGKARPSVGAGGLAPSAAPETSTGNKNLDLLLELQGKGGDVGDAGLMAGKGAAAAASPTPASAAAAAAAAKALAALRAKAAEQPPAEGAQPKPALPLGGGLGLMDDDAKRAQPAERRDWSGQMGGGGGHRDAQHEPRDAGRADHPLLKLPLEVIAYLRENRFWVLGGIGLLLLLGAALKAYSRRV